MMAWRRLCLLIAVLLALITGGSGSLSVARAATNRAWVGGSFGALDTPTNWSPPGAPQDGDVLIFHRKSNSNLRSVHVFAPGAGLRVASITSDLETLTIDGAVSLTGSVFVENNQSEIDFQSLYLDSDAAEFSMPPIPFMAVPGAIRVTDQLRLRGTITAHGGSSSAKHLVGSGLITMNGGEFLIEDMREFVGTLSGSNKAELVFTSPAFTLDCDRAGTRVLLDATSSLKLDASCTNTLASVEGPGTIGKTPASPGVPQLRLADARGLFNGSVDPTAQLGLECCGTGTQRLGGDLSPMLQLDVTGGSVSAEDLQLSAGTITNVGNGASFGGYGSLGNVAVNKGTLVMGGGIGNFQSLTFSSSGNATFQIGGADPAGIGQARTKGVLDLGSASASGAAGELKLQFKNGYVPPIGQSLPLITGAAEVQGQFKGLPEGSTAALGGYPFRITYKGGASGHDVVVTRQATQASPTPPAGGELPFRRVLPGVGKDGP